jgi:hypothetical protein
MNTMRNVVLAAAAVAAMVIAAPTAAADPTPGPSPGYQIPAPGGAQFPGAQIYPPQCLRNMLPCGFRWDAGSGTWQPSARSAGE